MATIRAVEHQADYDTAREMFREYQERLVEEEGSPAAAHICFQDFESELADLPAMYGAPRGTILLAFDDEGVVGCVGIRAAPETGACEMKRLYLRQRARGSGLGRQLAEAALSAGKRMGYERMVLDTLPTMAVAVGLYTSLGFQQRDAFYEGAPTETLYFERVLSNVALYPENGASG